MEKYLWLDMEMSGLDPEQCRILEVAVIITDTKFQALGSYQAVIHQDEQTLAAMDAWNTKHHGESGLTEKVRHSKVSEQAAEAAVIALVDKHFAKDERVLLSGNTIGQDRKFISKYWPKLEERLHYRMLDVSSFKEVFRRQYGVDYKKKQAHRALDDIHESIAELQHYLSYVNLKMSGSA